MPLRISSVVFSFLYIELKTLIRQLMSLVKSNTLENQVTITGHQLEEIDIAKKKNLVLLKEVEVGNGVKEFG